MEEILKTELLEFDKSTFLIELVKHQTEKLYIRILQTIQQKDQPPIQQEININPSLVGSIVEVLKNYQESVSVKQISPKNYILEKDQQKIVDSYLKNVSIRDLALLFDCKEERIEQILRNRKIEIVDQKPPKPLFRKWHKRGWM